jgi:glycosyltransferase involved in cell wall biosynthesis
VSVGAGRLDNLPAEQDTHLASPAVAGAVAPMTERPLVWVVTPVHNGDRYLAECIDSVLSQTYDNWRYLVVDNRSTDRTPDIARDYAARDSRISLHRNSEFLPIIANWNHALRFLPEDAKYCKVVHADDTLSPECLERMVHVAEANPSVGIVTSYILWGDELRHDGFVPDRVEVIGGREICQATLEGRCYVFGSPSALLLRADLVRERPAFYNEENLHGDTEACFDLLRTVDLGFAHQVLTRKRVHAEAMTSFAVRINTFHHGWLTILAKYGACYLDRGEYARQLALRMARYLIFLAKAALQGKFRDPSFREHHRATVGLMLRTIRGRQSKSPA